MKAKYFCESCRSEVPASASSCPYCGEKFTAVRCPKCGFESEARLFAAGCPSCGFMGEVVHAKSLLREMPASKPTIDQASAGPRRALPPVFYKAAGFALLAMLILLVALLILRS